MTAKVRTLCFAALALGLCLGGLKAQAPSDAAVSQGGEKEADESQASKQSSEAAATSFRPPAHHNVRYEEDWYRSPAAEGDQSLKYIPIGDGGLAYLNLGGQIRQRTEFWADFAFTEGPGRGDAFGLLRLRLHANLYVGPHLRFFVEGKSALSSGRGLPGGNRPIDIDRLDLLNALVDVKAPLAGDRTFTLRAGRQELQLGRQRLVSPLDWANTRRTFDAVRGILELGSWRLDSFYGRLVRVRKYDFNPNDSGSDLFGTYLTGPIGKGGLSMDVYWLGLDRENSLLGGLTGQEERHTVGARLGGRLGQSRWDFDAEGAFQFGDHAGREVRSSMFSGEVGRRFLSTWAPRIFFGFDYAGGDEDPSDDRVGTFNQLFPLAHAYLGFADVTARQNNIDVRAGMTFKPRPKVTVRGDLHQLWRAEESDALYNAGGGVLRQGAAGTPKEVGREIDLTVLYAFRPGWLLSSGYSRVFAGDFIRATGPAQDINFGHLGLQYTF